MDVKLRDAWHPYRDRIIQLAVNKSSSNADLRAITDALVDQYDEGLTLLLIATVNKMYAVDPKMGQVYNGVLQFICPEFQIVQIYRLHLHKHQ